MNPASSRALGVAAWPSQVIEDFRAARRRGDDTPLEMFWPVDGSSADPEAIAALALLIKEDLRLRFAAGEHPAVADYLDRFPVLCRSRDRMISLVYEEFCLREDHGERPDPESFCQRYEPWRDSLLSQLRFHDAFSRLASSPRRPVQFPAPGERFRRFQLCSELGRGGVARVYLARDDDLGGRKFALKLSPDHGSEPTIQGQLDHPHIVAVTHVEHEPETGLRGLCMPYWPGLPLNEVIQRIDPSRSRPRTADVLWNILGAPGDEDRDIEDAGRPTWGGYPRDGSHADAVAWIGLKLAEALAHAHSRGIIHRDIKPANILLTRRGGPLLLDFNLSQSSRHVEEADAANRGGTLPYMAPEQLWAFLKPEEWDKLQPSADLYSLGLVLRELLIGEQPPLPRPGLPADLAVLELIDLRDKTRAPSVCSVNSGVPRALDAILARCLAPNLEERYADAESLAEDLRRFLARRPLKTAHNPSRRERLGNWSHRNRVALRTMAMCLAIAPIVYTGALLLNPGKSYDDLIHLGTQDASRGRYDKAISWFLVAEERSPQSFRAYQGLAAVYKTRADLSAREFADLVDPLLARPSDINTENREELLKLAQTAEENYTRSDDHYLRAITLADAEGIEPHKIANLQHDSAMVMAEWSLLLRRLSLLEYFSQGEQLEAAAEDYNVRADTLCLRAMATLNQADSRLEVAKVDDTDPDIIEKIRCKLRTLSAQLHLRRGEIASLGDHYPESVAHFRKAKELITDAEKMYNRLELKPSYRQKELPERSTFQRVRMFSEARLNTDSPKLPEGDVTTPGDN